MALLETLEVGLRHEVESRGPAADEVRVKSEGSFLGGGQEPAGGG
jgi:hypothetical protein